MAAHILLLPGDGIGPEVMEQAKKVLEAVRKCFGFDCTWEEKPFGGAGVDACGDPLPAETLEAARKAHAILAAAIGGPRWDSIEPERRPEKGLMRLRRELGLFANLRPAKVYEAVVGSSPLKADRVLGVDLLIVRELTGGIYYGRPRGVEVVDGVRRAINTMVYDEHEVERIARVAFDLAMKRRRKVTSVDKANVLEVSQLWRAVVSRIGGEYPEVELNHLYVDNCAMQLVLHPRQFDVMVTGNLFGDILSDEAATLVGSIGLLPSGSFGGEVAFYEPAHGSAPDIAGQDKANPLAMISSASMMLRYSFDQSRAADAVDAAIQSVLEQGYRTADLLEEGCTLVGTSEVGDRVADAVMTLGEG